MFQESILLSQPFLTSDVHLISNAVPHACTIDLGWALKLMAMIWPAWESLACSPGHGSQMAPVAMGTCKHSPKGINMKPHGLKLRTGVQACDQVDMRLASALIGTETIIQGRCLLQKQHFVP